MSRAQAAGEGGGPPLAFDLAGYQGFAVAAAAKAVHTSLLPDPRSVAEAGTPLRPSVSRLTSRVSLPDLGPVLLKVHRTRSRVERLLSLVRPSRARREFEAARFLQAGGIPVPAPLAYGEQRRAGLLESSFFAACFVDGMRTVREGLPHQPADKRLRLLERLARSIRSLHGAGFDHRDLHSGNVLVGPGPGDQCRILVTDLHRSSWGRSVGRRARQRAVAQWLHSLGDTLDARGRRRWIAEYRSGAPGLDGWCEVVERHIERIERTRRRSRGKRCFKESTVYTLDIGAGRGARRRSLPLARLEAVLREHDLESAPGRPGLVKRGRKGVVTRHGDIVVKERRPTSVLARLRDTVFPARHAAGYRNAHMLGVRGIGAARPLACVRRAGRFLTLYEDLSELPRLDHLARDLYGRSVRGRQTALRDASATFVGGLHRAGIYHGDLKGVNVLVEACGDGFAFRLIDTDHCRFGEGPLDRRRRVKNLAQLAASIPVSVTRTERLRWYRRYAEAAGVEEEPKMLARDVQAALARKILVVDEPIE